MKLRQGFVSNSSSSSFIIGSKNDTKVFSFLEYMANKIEKNILIIHNSEKHLEDLIENEKIFLGYNCTPDDITIRKARLETLKNMLSEYDTILYYTSKDVSNDFENLIYYLSDNNLVEKISWRNE